MTVRALPLSACAPEALLALAPGCAAKTEEQEQAPLGQPITFVKGGSVVASVDAAWVQEHAPEIPWGQGYGWRLGPQLSERYTQTDQELKVGGAAGDAVVSPRPDSRVESREPVLVTNQRGRALVTFAAPAPDPEASHRPDVTQSEFVGGYSRSAATSPSSPTTSRSSRSASGWAGFRSAPACRPGRSLRLRAISPANGRTVVSIPLLRHSGTSA